MSGKRIHLTVVDSTNSYTMQLIGQNDIEEYTMITAGHQSNGKGQRGKSWQSDEGQNLLSSVYIKPMLKLEQQFLISASSALLLVELLQGYGVIAKVKWPNDVFVNGKKIAGFLIENQIQGDVISASIIGLGLNVNQQKFGDYPWLATSLSLETNNRYNVEDVATQWQLLLAQRMKEWLNNKEGLVAAFNAKLYLKNQLVSFMHKDQELQGKVLGVNLEGALLLELNGEQRPFYNGEIKLKRTSF